MPRMPSFSLNFKLSQYRLTFCDFLCNTNLSEIKHYLDVSSHFTNGDGSAFPVRTILGNASVKSMTVVGSEPQNPPSTTIST